MLSISLSISFIIFIAFIIISIIWALFTLLSSFHRCNHMEIRTTKNSRSGYNKIQYQERIHHRLASIQNPESRQQSRQIYKSKDLAEKVNRAKSIIIGQKYKKYKLNLQCLDVALTKNKKTNISPPFSSQMERKNYFFAGVRSNSNIFFKKKRNKAKTEGSRDLLKSPKYQSRNKLGQLNFKNINIQEYLKSITKQQEQRQSRLLENKNKNKQKKDIIFNHYLQKISASPSPQIKKQINLPLICLQKSLKYLKTSQNREKLKRISTVPQAETQNIKQKYCSNSKEEEYQRWEVNEDHQHPMLNNLQIPFF